MSGIFVSHASADRSLVDPFVDDVLRLGCEIPRDLIFYSSGEDTGIPSGRTLNEYLQSKIGTASLVIAIVSPEFQARPFCVAELGAAWSRVGRLFPIAVPGLESTDLDGVLSGLVVRYLNDAAALDEMHDAVSDALGRSSSARTWGRYRTKWLASVDEHTSTLLASAKSRQGSGNISSLHLASTINEWGLEGLVEHRPGDDVIRRAIRGCTEIHITCQVDSADWTEHFAREIRAFLRYGDSITLNIPDLSKREVRRELSVDGRFDEDRHKELERLAKNFVELQEDSEFGRKIVINRIPRCPAYSSALFINSNVHNSVGYIRLYAHRMHLARDLPTLYFRYGGKLWRFVEEDLVNVESI